MKKTAFTKKHFFFCLCFLFLVGISPAQNASNYIVKNYVADNSEPSANTPQAVQYSYQFVYVDGSTERNLIDQTVLKTIEGSRESNTTVYLTYSPTVLIRIFSSQYMENTPPQIQNYEFISQKDFNKITNK